MTGTTPLMEVRDLVRTFGGGRSLFGTAQPAVHAVRGVDLDVRRGETLGIVGESGCGKSTIGRMLTGLDGPTGGTIRFEGEDLARLVGRDPRSVARRIQFVFQDPIASLNPRKTIRQSMEAPLKHLLGMKAAERRKRTVELMEAVNLSPDFLGRYPHEFSGGQAQRIGIARALAADPDLIILDEPVSALDVSVQAQVLGILDRLKTDFGLTYIFISHDLAVVESVSDRIAILYFGRVAEIGPARALFARARHHYTQLLLRSVPSLRGMPETSGDAEGELPDPYDPPPGCAFASRCPAATQICRTDAPALEAKGANAAHRTACHHPVPDSS